MRVVASVWSERGWLGPMRWFGIGLGILLTAHGAYSADDRFIEGYTRALLDQEYRLSEAVVEVADGVVTVRAKDFGGIRTQELIRVLEGIPGVARVTVEGEDGPSAPMAVPGGAPAETSIPSPWLPRGLLFEPLHADPRWPHFALVYRRVLDSGLVKNGAAANVGGTVALYRSRPARSSQWEVGLQAGSFSLFDLSATSGSNDILNTDFSVALFYGYRSGKVSGLVRLAHQSSHLGDEFMQNTETPRIEVNHDRVDFKLSYDVLEWLRIYGGGGLLLRQSPDGLGVGTVQGGIELTSLTTYWSGRLRPVAYADMQLHERTGWSYGQSVMAGVQFENLRLDGRAIQLLVEHYTGSFPDGQFFTQKTQWIGVGLHFYF